MFNNPFNKISKVLGASKPGKGNETIPVAAANVVESTENTQNEAIKLPAESLEAQLAKIEEVKEKITELQKGRSEHYLHAKQLEEQLTMKGLTGEKIQEIKDQIMGEGAAISEIINSLRKEYGLDPKPVEIYEARLEMIMKEIGRVKENMAPAYREIKGSMKSYFGNSSMSETAQRNLGGLNNFRTYVLEKNVTLPEVKSFYDEVKDLRFYEELDIKLFAEKYKEFAKTIDNAIEKNTLYKTQGEMNEVQERLDRLVMLSDDIYKELRDAENKEGRFAPKEDKYF